LYLYDYQKSNSIFFCNPIIVISIYIQKNAKKKNDPYGVGVKKKEAKKGFPQILSTMQKNSIQKYFFF
tara:strand:- start:796 stop:999 length:204 start_codon:yes stop_codon:yes gene_type:complete